MKVSYIYILGVSYLAILSFCVYFLGLNQLNTIAFFKNYDTISYLDAAAMLKAGAGFHATRCVAYPLILNCVEFLVGQGPLFFYAIYFLQSIMLFIVFLLQYKWMSTIIMPKYAIAWTLLGLLNLTYFFYAYFLLTEISCLFFIALSFESYFQYFKTRKAKFLFVATFLFGIAILFKPGLFLYLLLCIGVGTFFLVRKRVFRFHFIALYLGLFSSLGAQWVGMYSTYGEVKLSYISDITYYRYLHTSVLALSDQKEILPLMQIRDSLVSTLEAKGDESISYPKFAQKVQEERKQLLAAHSKLFLKAFALNLFSNFHTGNNTLLELPNDLVKGKTTKRIFYDLTRIWNMVYVIALILTSVMCFVFWIRHALDKVFSPQLFMIMGWLSFSLFTFVITGVSFYQGDRFNVIWMPFLIPAVVFLGALIRSILSSKTSTRNEACL